MYNIPRKLTCGPWEFVKITDNIKYEIMLYKHVQIGKESIV